MVRPSRVGFLAAILALAAMTAGCASEEPGSEAWQILDGEVHSAEGGISIETGEWTYSVPLDGVQWVDKNDIWHDQGRPECLPPMNAPATVTFAAVEVTIEGTTWRPVVWVDCRQ